MAQQERAAAAEAAGAGRNALVASRVPAEPRAAVLFLHGGRADSRAPSRPWHLAALRMRPFVRAVAAAVPGDVLLGEVRYRVRGWNGPDADPLRDTRRALAELARRYGDVPTVLVGHSMGGRAALRAAVAPQVRAVLTLAPWCPDGEPVAHLRDKDVVVLHGDRDRITDPRASMSFADRARAAGARTRSELVAGGDHAMLRRGGHWHRAAAEGVAALLAGR
ncbi:alpha/beta fold hydrolase [Streptomyces doudnae]|uniref:Alpha/beta fold hydrolase n=2 Tax=Streptomyces TaxID=1883 RepID=A0ABD5EJU1_9ACTN|nr:alpha/beta fold hydrolase [Streptomyces sp. DSM 41981]MDT0433672.1 alpha/beta fold hydrolase [Streptomyces sp. DSM 41981]